MNRHSPVTLSRARAIARGIGAILGVVVGIFYSGYVISNSPGLFAGNQSATSATLAGSAVVGAAALALAAPLLTIDPYLWLQGLLDEAPAGQIVGAAAGIVTGLVIAALVAALLAPLPFEIGPVVSIGLAAALVRVGARAGTGRGPAFAAVFRGPLAATPVHVVDGTAPIDGPPIVVDTSALIDGRIVDVAKAGFIPGRLLIAGFVLEELQRVADSSDPARRARGRRGLGVLEELRERNDVVCETVDLSFADVGEVDARLIKLAVSRSAMLLTSDHNLNRIARVAGVRVLNLNDLANALKPILTSGEQISIAIVREGKELNQGIGYLDDGTMVVVENGRDRLGTSVRATVSSVLQTSSGRIIFSSTEPAGAPAEPEAAAPVRTARPRTAPR